MEGWRPVEDLIRWGFGHAPGGAWTTEGHSGTSALRPASDPFVIDQTVTVEFSSRRQPWVRELLAPLGETLAAYGGNAGILRDQAPPPLDGWTGIDAVVVSADNELTQ